MTAKKDDTALISMTPEEFKKLIDKERKSAVSESKRKQGEVQKKQSQLNISRYKDISGLADDDFCKLLMTYHIKAEDARFLRDSQKTLTNVQLYKYIRESNISTKLNRR